MLVLSHQPAAACAPFIRESCGCVVVATGHVRRESDVSSVSLDSSVPDSGVNVDDISKINVCIRP